MYIPLTAEPATKDDIRIILDQMDKRFEQIDKRFEQVDKRFDQLMWFIGLWIPASLGAVGYALQRIARQEERIYDISTKKNSMDINRLIDSISKSDSATKKRLREVLKS